jgi:hypothetical protein
MSLQSHGAINRVFLLFFICLETAIAIVIYIEWRVFKFSFILGITSVAALLIGYFVFLDFSCSGWSNGMRNSKIDNDGFSCKINPPSYCPQMLLDGVFDANRFSGYTCKGTGSIDEWRRFLKNNNTKILGFPRMESLKTFPDSDYHHYGKNVMNNMIDMEDASISEQIKNKTEVTINFKEAAPKVTINLKRNDTLALERNKISLEYPAPLFKNVFYLFIDSISRPLFKYKLPKTYKWIEKYYNSK